MDESLYRKFYEVERSHWWFLARREILLSVIMHYVPTSGRILDVGCGTGFFIEKAREVYDAWGVDDSPLAVSMCRDRGLVNVFEGSAYDLSNVSNKLFEAMLYLDVIEHLEDDFTALRRANEMLAIKGIVIITVPAYMFMWSQHDELNQHKRRYVMH
ncbi:MAG: class I SAM-dependent methyltransferase, partial [Pyrinomonadaceae bacterium]